MSEDIEMRGLKPGLNHPGLGAVQIDEDTFVGPIEAIKVIRLPPEFGGNIVDVVKIHRSEGYVYYQLDNESPNTVVDTGSEFRWANKVWDEEE